MIPVILAAGKGTRLQTDVPKTLYKVGGKPIIDHIFMTLNKVKRCRKPIVVIGYKAEQVRRHLGAHYIYVTQTELTGTATALSAALPHLPADKTLVGVFYGDQPFINKKVVESALSLYKKEKPVLIITTFTVPQSGRHKSLFTHYGRVVRDRAGSPVRIVEYKNATQKERSMAEVSAGTMYVQSRWLRTALPRITLNARTGEYYLTDLVALARQDGKKVMSIEVSAVEACGINSAKDVQSLQRIRLRKV